MRARRFARRQGVYQKETAMWPVEHDDWQAIYHCHLFPDDESESLLEMVERLGLVDPSSVVRKARDVWGAKCPIIRPEVWTVLEKN